MNKRIISFAAAIAVVTSIPFSAYAHSGRTDSSGGHKDNKNVSGLGSYHYHCGGYPAHLHTNGVCPYSSTSSSSSTTDNSSSKASKAEWIGDMYWTGDSFAKGWTKIGGKTYYFDSYGSKVTGWVNDEDDNTYYFGTDGVLRVGWQTIGKNKYYFNSEGIMRTGWRKIGGYTYYFGTDGIMRTGLD
ncbi:MAG: N-acetylmuramoyl-L-alanine amidase family protein, partial [Oscillospiraceae bacterium]